MAPGWGRGPPDAERGRTTCLLQTQGPEREQPPVQGLPPGPPMPEWLVPRERLCSLTCCGWLAPRKRA